MTATPTLTQAPLAPLLARLFAEGETADRPLQRELASRSPEERAAFMATARTDYRAFYGQAKDMFLAVSPQTGTLLYMLARSSKAQRIVELGTSFGLSTLHLAAALKDNGGGLVIGTEFEAAKAERAREHLATAGLADFAEIRDGDALSSLAHDLPASIDMVLLDGAKVLYPRILALLEPRLSHGALIVADNAGDSPEYLARVRNSSDYLSIPFGGDVELSMCFLRKR